MSSNLIFKSHHYGEIFGVITDNSSSQSTMIWTFVSIVKTNGQYMLKNAIMIWIWFWEYVLTILQVYVTLSTQVPELLIVISLWVWVSPRLVKIFLNRYSKYFWGMGIWFLNFLQKRSSYDRLPNCSTETAFSWCLCLTSSSS